MGRPGFQECVQAGMLKWRWIGVPTGSPACAHGLLLHAPLQWRWWRHAAWPAQALLRRLRRSASLSGFKQCWTTLTPTL